jgi:hypothetical protein
MIAQLEQLSRKLGTLRTFVRTYVTVGVKRVSIMVRASISRGLAVVGITRNFIRRSWGKVVVLVEQIKLQLRTLRSLPEALADEISAKTLPDESKSVARLIMTVSLGLIFMALFLPLTWITAKHRALHPVDVLLFVQAEHLKAGGLRAQVRSLFLNPQTLYAFGVLYGLCTLLLAFLSVLRKDGVLDLLITSNGLLAGYLATGWIGQSLYGMRLPVGSLHQLSFAYVLAAYYAAVGLIGVCDGWGSIAKYQHVFLGVQGLLAGWILSRKFGGNAVLFGGLTFITCSFVAMVIVENTMIWPLKWVLQKVPQDTRLLGPSVFTFGEKFWTLEIWDEALIWGGQDIPLFLPTLGFMLLGKIVDVLTKRFEFPILLRMFPIEC